MVNVPFSKKIGQSDDEIYKFSKNGYRMSHSGENKADETECD